MHFPAQKILADTIHRRLLANNPRNFFLEKSGQHVNTALGRGSSDDADRIILQLHPDCDLRSVFPFRKTFMRTGPSGDPGAGYRISRAPHSTCRHMKP